jgi:hypothetical protein
MGMRAPLLLLIAAALLTGCGGVSRSATTPHVAHIRGGTIDPDPDGLGPTNAPTSAPHRRLPPLRTCARTFRQDFEMDAAKVAGGADCSTARHIAIRVSRASWERCDVHCAERYPIGFGYRCDAFWVGEAAWSVDCRRGLLLVHLAITD